MFIFALLAYTVAMPPSGKSLLADLTLTDDGRPLISLSFDLMITEKTHLLLSMGEAVSYLASFECGSDCDTKGMYFFKNDFSRRIAVWA